MGNPYHDALGRFTTGHGGFSTGKRTGIASTPVHAASDADFGSVAQRFPEGIEVKPVYKADGTLDKVASLKNVPDEVLHENIRLALRQCAPWTVEAGTRWYPGARKLSGRLTEKYSGKFQQDHGIELNEAVTGGLISVYSRNNGWIRNVVGVRQFLDNPNSVNAAGKKPMHVTMKGGALELISFVKARHAAGYKDDFKNVDDFFGQSSTAPKPHNFFRSIMGNEDNAAIDRWMARIILHTDNTDFAAAIVGASRSRMVGPKGKGKTRHKVEVNSNFSRMRAALRHVAREPEFAGFTTSQLQAIPWIHLVGPVGAVGDVTDLSSDSAAKRGILAVAGKNNWKG